VEFYRQVIHWRQPTKKNVFVATEAVLFAQILFFLHISRKTLFPEKSRFRFSLQITFHPTRLKLTIVLIFLGFVSRNGCERGASPTASFEAVFVAKLPEALARHGPVV